ncbi:coproporphyrinogen dehydrogenase HemZ [Lutibacter sp. B2]|nr:coproporphyrinogen dehydrogenase HemZ [Lutibacter sp. B2]
MLNIFLEGHDYKYDVGELLKLFIEADKINFIEEKSQINKEKILLVSKYYKNEIEYVFEAKLFKNKEVILQKKICINNDEKDLLKVRKWVKRNIKLCMYDVISKFYNKYHSWGMLTGIRPTKIVHELMDQGIDEDEIRKKLKNDYRICEEKINLLFSVVHIERPIILNNNSEYVSLYIGIPFCPTRCVYCSFPSNKVDSSSNIMDKYLDALIYEINETTKVLDELNKKVDTIYIGGGTPTTLNEIQLDKLCRAIKSTIDMHNVREFTVEAGRPDTITKEKLMVLKKHGIERISINPQTMNQETLEKIGRNHTIEDLSCAYRLAKDIGFKTINMDVIIGLPGENPEMMEFTMKKIQELNPENLTVHTLAIKKSSALKQNKDQYVFSTEDQAEEMLKISKEYAQKMGLNPYYMYRQKYMLGNLENIGYTKPNHECIYNVQIIDERQTIIALGAGAVSKIFYPHENRFERVPNVTNLEQYISRIEEMVNRKRIELLK